MNKKILTCGHSVSATITVNGVSKPGCAICGCTEEEEAATQPNLGVREMQCSYGAHAILPSDPKAAFFEHRPKAERDRYYCGCCGWN